MKIIDILEEDKMILNHHFISKKRLFETMANLLSDDSAEALRIYHSIVNREKLGNTSLGNGVALPHGKCLAANEIRACVIRMAQAADYEAVDDIPVHVVVGIAFPYETNEMHQVLMKETAFLFRQHRLYKNMLLAENKKQMTEEILKGFQLCNNWS
ncbi:PTS sugar transporter subunit IIA [Marinicella sp. S1101]|uniref:PTS sugar transporter subunit IIA n=1 Tax=Marinicella marina TaxID=2996016 RepID=UPI00226096ED|nr:PTS sugar transporter subunit IIA [Marinicella marina]MCX7554631.1 PTS sugar transporter subunit IIA [Marinicella marina]MDJ1140696.1 PTS sugar transporter subunit IIA [Marinicella marina]